MAEDERGGGKRFEGSMSEDYEFVPRALPYYFELQEALGAAIAARYEHPEILEIGVGTGNTTRAILSRNPGCRVVGIDNERRMIDQARDNLKPEIARGVVELHHGDASDYLRSLPHSSADVVASSMTIHNFPGEQRRNLLIEILRVSRPGGMFINNDRYAADDREEYVRELTAQIIRYDVLEEAGRADLRRIWIQHELEDELPGRIMRTGQSLEQLKDIGFVDVRLARRAGQYAIITAMKPK